jgi:predicted small lipoprotein YifL
MRLVRWKFAPAFIVLAMVVLFAPVACGKKGAPLPPEDAQPTK